MTDEDLRRLYPSIPWREPVKVKVLGGAEGWACRLCIARYGLKADDVGALGDLESFPLANFHDIDPA